MGVGAIASSYAAAGGAWTPAALGASLKAWYDASDAGSFTYSSGVLVSQWNDLSGNGNHLTQATAGNQGSRNGTQNGLDAVVFASNDYMTADITDISTPHTAFLVVKQAVGDDYFIDNVTGSAAALRSQFGGWKMISGGESLGQAGSADTNMHCHVALWNGGAGSSYMRVDGAVILSGALAATSRTGIALNWLALGFAASGQTTCEVGIVSGALSGDDLTDLETYLSIKWGTP